MTETRPDRLAQAREAFHAAVEVEGTGTVRGLDDGVRAYVARLAEGNADLLARLEDPDFRNEFQHLRSWTDLDAMHSEAAEAIRTVQTEKALLAAELEAARKDNERLAAIAEGRLGDARLLKAGPDGQGGFSFDLSGGPVQFIAEYLAQFLGKGEEGGLRNYAEIEVHHGEIGPMTLTLQRRAGKTPHQFRQEAEDREATLQARLDAIEALLADLRADPKDTDGREASIVETACKGYWPMHWPKHFDPTDSLSIKGHMRKAAAAAVAELLLLAEAAKDGDGSKP